MIAITRAVDEWIQIGDSVLVGPTDIDPRIVRLIARGKMIGGPDDGGTFQVTAELAKGQSMRIGPHIQVAALDMLGDAVRLGVTCPPHLPVHRKEMRDNADQ